MAKHKRLTQSAKKALFGFQKLGFNTIREGNTHDGEYYVSLEQSTQNGQGDKRAFFQSVGAIKKGIIDGEYAVAFGKDRNKALVTLAKNFEQKATDDNCMVVVSGPANDIKRQTAYQASENGEPKAILIRDLTF